MTEQAIQAKITKYLKSIGAYNVKTVATTKAGVPDILVCYKGLFIGIEVKKPETKNNVSDLQQYNIDKIIQAEGYAFVAWSLDMVKDKLAMIERAMK